MVKSYCARGQYFPEHTETGSPICDGGSSAGGIRVGMPN